MTWSQQQRFPSVAKADNSADIDCLGKSQDGAPPGLSFEALFLVARLHHVAADAADLAHQLGLAPTHVVTTSDLLVPAKALGLKAKLIHSTSDRLTLVALPALALVTNVEDVARVVVLAHCDGQRVLYQHPSADIRAAVLPIIASCWGP